MASGPHPARAHIIRVIGVAGAVVFSGCHRVTAPAVRADSVAGSTPAPPATPKAFTRLPRDAARFEIEVVDDSTVRFKPREALWVREGMTGYAVDPMNRDAMVARLRIVSVWNETAVAVVTSQVTRITTRHVVLLPSPVIPWWKTRRFWLGTLVGAVVGGTIGGVLGAQ